ncbi:hypothetical protein DFH11DRAFT_432048 [Phellopilus nigrolimitatus]|nr:hypothetical protein DFH11DRAFT_432048 [Phellopilus nigrolimitatus]
MSTRGFPSDHSKDGRITLPPIRDILREELTSSPKPSPRSLNAPFALGPLRSALSEDSSPRMSASSRLSSMSPEMGYTRRSFSTRPPSPPQHSFGPPSPDLSARRPVPEYSILHRSSSGVPISHSHSHCRGDTYRSNFSSSSETPVFHSQVPASGPNRKYYEPPRVPRMPSVGHRRRGSSDSAWSSHTSSSGSSSHIHSSPPSNALQFQPLPHAHTNSPLARSPNNLSSRGHASTSSASAEYQSPFGVLIADVDPHGVPPADPQRMAILRTLGTTGGLQGSFPLRNDDPKNLLQSARYECPYCPKRFNRPSSLKIHINSHTGEKPFECTEPGCGRRFSVQSNMRRHSRVHQAGSRKAGESSGDEQEDQERSAVKNATFDVNAFYLSKDNCVLQIRYPHKLYFHRPGLTVAVYFNEVQRYSAYLVFLLFLVGDRDYLTSNLSYCFFVNG